ncbi:MAG: amidohydrolase family protein [SAR202 cluster bacterium]|jgi:imidazolonepropionase-like amidohydrolase|nr:amidohydrolase family protein [SAR202 cluster bacterium]
MRLVLKADRLIDGTGAVPVENAAVVVESGRITEVTTQDRIQTGERDDADTVTVPGGTLMPGFIEVHTHIHCSAQADAYRHITTESNETFLMRGVQAVRAALSSGVTTMRDLGSRNPVIFPLKQAVEDGIVPGPRMLVAGTPITTTGGHCNMFGTEADTSDEVVAAVRGQFKSGADWIKVMSTGGGFTPGTNVRAPQYPVETLKAAVQDAERLNLRVAAHCHASAGVRNCVDAGVHNLIHCSWLAEDPDELYDYDTDYADMIAEAGIYVDPTLALGRLNQLRGRVRPLGAPERDPARRFEILRDMWDRGVKFVTGMDAGMTNANFDDFAYIPQVMVEEMHIAPMEAIVCSTQTSADCLGVLDETGTVEVGKAADVLIVDGNPVEDITALHNVNSIVKQGAVVKREGELLI